MAHSYDGYRPDLSSECPHMDWLVYTSSYLTALTRCYAGYLDKARQAGGTSGLIECFCGIILVVPFLENEMNFFIKPM